MRPPYAPPEMGCMENGYAGGVGGEGWGVHIVRRVKTSITTAQEGEATLRVKVTRSVMIGSFCGAQCGFPNTSPTIGHAAAAATAGARHPKPFLLCDEDLT